MKHKDILHDKPVTTITALSLVKKTIIRPTYETEEKCATNAKTKKRKHVFFFKITITNTQQYPSSSRINFN